MGGLLDIVLLRRTGFAGLMRWLVEMNREGETLHRMCGGREGGREGVEGRKIGGEGRGEGGRRKGGRKIGREGEREGGRAGGRRGGWGEEEGR